MRLVLIATYGDGYTFSYTEALPIIWESKESAEFEVLRILELKKQWEKDVEKFYIDRQKLLQPRPPKIYNGKNPKVIEKFKKQEKEYEEQYSAWVNKMLEKPNDTVMLFGQEMYFSDLDEHMQVLTLDEWYNDKN